jgi:putative oxidoreductase
MIEKLLHTDSDYPWTFLRVIAGLIVFPYGMQKLFGWFGGRNRRHPERPGFSQDSEKHCMADHRRQSFGSIALIAGFFGRIAAGGLFIIFTGALIVHLPDGWTMNWFGEKKGEGIEYHIMLLALLLIVIVRGSGAMSIDLWLTS